MIMEVIAHVIMVFSSVSGVIGLVTASSKKYFYISAFIMHITLAAATKILMNIDPTPGITVLNLIPMKLMHWHCLLVHWYCLLVGFCLIFAVLLIGIPSEYRAEKNAATENHRDITNKD